MSHPRGGGDDGGISAPGTMATAGDAASAFGSQGAAVQRDWRALLLAFYAVHNRERMGEVDDILARFRGKVRGRGRKRGGGVGGTACPFTVAVCACVRQVCTSAWA